MSTGLQQQPRIRADLQHRWELGMPIGDEAIREAAGKIYLNE